MRLIAGLLAIVIGGAMSLQAKVTADLGAEIHNPYLAAWISITSGLVFLTMLMLFMPSGRRGLRDVVAGLRSGNIVWWEVIGGLSGGYLVLTQGLVAGLVGISLYSAAIIAGQSLGGLGVDAVGLGPGGKIQPSFARVLGVVVAMVAVLGAIVVYSAGVVTNMWLLLLPFVAGAVQTWQQAVNGRVRNYSSSVLTATWLNFLFGFLFLTVACIIQIPSSGYGLEVSTVWWHYSGGVLGCLFIAIAAQIVHVIGVLALSLATVIGQLTTSLILDLWFPAIGGVGVSSTTLSVLGMIMLSVVLIMLPPKPRIPRRIMREL